MRIYLADDEEILLKGELKTIRECCPNDEVLGFRTGEELLMQAEESPCDVAFLDINLERMSGIRVAEELKKLNPKVNIIFVTAYDDYYREAMRIRASGYLTKPLVPSLVTEELKNLRFETESGKAYLLNITCLGNFEVRNRQGGIVRFDRSKSKEAFAYLVHLSGSSCTVRELAAVLFEDEPFDHKNQIYIQKIISSMMKCLRENDAAEVVEKNFNSIALKTEKVNCDYYEYLAAHEEARFVRPPRYMEQYSWAMY